MRHRLVKSILTALLAGGASDAYTQSATVYEPGASDRRIVAVLAARQRAADAASKGDWKSVEAAFAADVVVNSPTNRIVMLADIMARFRSGRLPPSQGQPRTAWSSWACAATPSW